VSAVAVVTFRGFRIPKLRYFSVVRVEVRLSNSLVATTAFSHNIELEPLLVSPLYGVRAVAAAANRKGLVGFPHHRGVDTLHEVFLNTVVTSSTCLGYVPWIHRRRRIAARTDAVRRVAIRAHRGHRKSTLHEPLAVDAFGIPLDNLMLAPSVPNRRFLPFPVTPSAQNRNIRGECGRTGINFP
jgi:hypothetical protein